MGVKTKRTKGQAKKENLDLAPNAAQLPTPEPTPSPHDDPDEGSGMDGMRDRTREPVKLFLKVGGYDMRKEIFKGLVEIEEFAYRDIEGSFVVLRRDQVRSVLLRIPLTWVIPNYLTLVIGQSDKLAPALESAG
jgi:hypothetical protein